MNTRFLSERLRGRDHSEDLGVDGTIILEYVLKKLLRNMWSGFICFRRGTFRFHKMQGNS
jgi:hypothetical protein